MLKPQVASAVPMASVIILLLSVICARCGKETPNNSSRLVCRHCGEIWDYTFSCESPPTFGCEPLLLGNTTSSKLKFAGYCKEDIHSPNGYTVISLS